MVTAVVFCPPRLAIDRTSPMRFVLYTRRGCHLCEQAEDLLAVHGVDCDVVDVDADAGARDRFGLRVPVLAGDGRVLLEGRFDEPALAVVLTGLR